MNLKIIFLLMTFPIIAFSQTIDISNFKQISKGSKYPPSDLAEAGRCTSEVMLYVNNRPTPIFPSKIGNRESIIVGENYIDKKEMVTKLKSTNCSIELNIDGDRIYVSSTDNEKDIAYSMIAPSKVCSKLSSKPIPEKDKATVSSSMSSKINNSLVRLQSMIKTSIDEREKEGRSSIITRDGAEFYKSTYSSCGKILSELGSEYTKSVIKNNVELNVKIMNEQYGVSFTNTNFGSAHPLVSINPEFKLSENSVWLSSCVDNLYDNSEIKSFYGNLVIRDNIVRDGKPEGERLIIQKNDKFFAVSKEDMEKVIQDNMKKYKDTDCLSCTYQKDKKSFTQEFKIRIKSPNSEDIGVVSKKISNIYEGENKWNQSESLTLTNGNTNPQIDELAVVAHEVPEQIALGAIVSSIRNSLISYDPSKYPKATVEMNKESFSDCKSIIDGIAPSEYRLNNIAYQTVEPQINNSQNTRATSSIAK